MTRKVLYMDNFLSVEQDKETGCRFVRTTDAGVVLVYLPERDSILIISQNRPAIVNDANPSGNCLDAVAGRMDYEVGIRQLLANELLEEAGITVAADDITLLNNGESLTSSPGFATERKHLAYVEVQDSQVESLDDLEREYGNEHEGEKIKRHLIPVKNLEEMVWGDLTLFALIQWFLKRKKS